MTFLVVVQVVGQAGFDMPCGQELASVAAQRARTHTTCVARDEPLSLSLTQRVARTSAYRTSSGMSFTVRQGVIAKIDILGDPRRLSRLQPG